VNHPQCVPYPHTGHCSDNEKSHYRWQFFFNIHVLSVYVLFFSLYILRFLSFAVKTGVLFFTYTNSIVKIRKEIANNKHPQAA
jgi:hypothetical protein